jgi:hypothetical protein
MGKNMPNDYKIYPLAIKIPNGRKIFKMAIKYTNIFCSKALQNIPELGFLVAYMYVSSGNPAEEPSRVAR